jgi:hypothetical protein
VQDAFSIKHLFSNLNVNDYAPMSRGHTQRWCRHTYDDYAAGGVGPDHGELFRHHELRNQFGFADSGRAMTPGEATEAALAKGAKGPLASV